MASKYINHRNPIDYLSCLPGQFDSFLEKNELIALATLNRQTASIFGANLEQQTYEILQEIQGKGWYITIQVKHQQLTHLYMKRICEETKETKGIPNVVYKLTTLEELVIRSYPAINISGGISENIGNLVNLETLDMKGIGITSILPESIKNITKLRIINLLGNKIISDIPKSWFQGETGPFRNQNSKIQIWKRASRGHPYVYIGSILNIPEEHKKTPFFQINDEWLEMPILCRTKRMYPRLKWYGVEWV